MKTTIKITKCGHYCPFFNGNDIMSCFHPYWDDKGSYDNCIINQDNIYGNNPKLPEKCPMKIEDLTIIYKLDNK